MNFYDLCNKLINHTLFKSIYYILKLLKLGYTLMIAYLIGWFCEFFWL